jgi:IclR family transcriptional regulator, KDG regulon repressor
MPTPNKRSSVISKSVSRAFALLELFRREQRPLTASAIESALGIPQPSALVLARELAELGYLSLDPATREYAPTARVAELGAWLGGSDLPRQRLRRIADDVARLTGETTTVCTASGRFLEVDHVAPGTLSGSILMRTGRAAPLARSGSGRAVLATFADDEARRFIEEAIDEDRKLALDLAEVLRDVRAARRNGALVTTDLMIDGIGAIAFPLPVATATGHFAIVVAGPSPRILQRRSGILRDCPPLIARRLAARPAGARPCVARQAS